MRRGNRGAIVASLTRMGTRGGVTAVVVLVLLVLTVSVTHPAHLF